MNPSTFARLRPARLGVRLPNWVGDVIQVTPALRALRRAFEGAEMVLVGPAKMEELVRGADWCQRYGASMPSGLDAAVVLPQSFRSAWEAWRAGAGARGGFCGELRSWMLTHAVPRIPGNRRTRPFSRISYLRRLLEGLGIPVADAGLELPLDSEAERGVEGVLRGAGIDPGRPFVLLNPGSAWGPTKRWPEANFSKAGDLLGERLGAQVLVLGGPGEMEEAKRIAEGCRAKAAALGPEVATLAMTKSIVKRAAVMVSNDSGPRHLAACYDVPCVVMVGPFHPVISHNGHGRTAMLYEAVECSPCHLRVCPIDHRCMTRITPENVLSAALRLLEGPKQT